MIYDVPDMKVSEILKERVGRPFASFEIVPPLKGSDGAKLVNMVRPLMEFRPPVLNFTAHTDEVEFVPNQDGSFKKVVVSKRPGTLAIVSVLAREFRDVEIVPHVICSGSSKEENERLLLDLHFIGIRNVMALRGDAGKGEKYFRPAEGGHSHSSSLVAQIKDMNAGLYLDKNMKDPVPTDFCIGVGAYPEKHIEAPNLETDIAMLKKKVDAGADYIITQMFFDNTKFFSFREKCRNAGIVIPIIPGIKPVSTIRQIQTLPQAFNLDLPQAFTSEIAFIRKNSSSDADFETKLYSFGIEWSVNQCKELVKSGVPAIHFYTMGKAENIRSIVSQVF